MSEAPIRWTCAGRSDRGAKRKINEDSILLRPDAGMWLAADGMGGHEAGDVASAMVATAVARVPVRRHLPTFVDGFENALVNVNREIRERAARDLGGRTMGSTVVSLVANDRFAVCLWAGDSRLYRKRAGKLEQITSDHSVVQELVERGLLTAEQAARHPDANVITRAVGGSPELYLDAVLVDVRDGDLYVLCSDGLYNELSSAEIGEALTADTEQAADDLLQRALGKGARDNVSLIVLHAQSAEPRIRTEGRHPERCRGVLVGLSEDNQQVRKLSRAVMRGEINRDDYQRERRRFIDAYTGEWKHVQRGAGPALSQLSLGQRQPVGLREQVGRVWIELVHDQEQVKQPVPDAAGPGRLSPRASMSPHRARPCSN